MPTNPSERKCEPKREGESNPNCWRCRIGEWPNMHVCELDKPTPADTCGTCNKPKCAKEKVGPYFDSCDDLSCKNCHGYHPVCNLGNIRQCGECGTDFPVRCEVHPDGHPAPREGETKSADYVNGYSDGSNYEHDRCVMQHGIDAPRVGNEPSLAERLGHGEFQKILDGIHDALGKKNRITLNATKRLVAYIESVAAAAKEEGRREQREADLEAVEKLHRAKDLDGLHEDTIKMRDSLINALKPL